MNTTPFLHPIVRVGLTSCALALLAGLTPIASAQETIPPARTATKPAELKRADRDFFEKAAKSGMEEVQISRVALERTTNPEIKRLAQMIVSDHEGVNAEVTSLASAKGVALAAKDSAPEKKWSEHKADSFDKDYLDKMVSAHEDAVKLFEREAKDGTDPEAVALARKHLAALQHHLEMALDLKRSLK